MTINKRYQILKSDRVLFAIFLIHLLLAFFHAAYSFYTEHEKTQAFIRCGFCIFIAGSTFFFLRPGFSFSILGYAYTLLYFNTFYNYTSFLFVLFAIYCTPRASKPALIIYALNVFIALAIKGSAILTLGIHGLNCFLFYVCARYLFQAIAQTSLMLTDDERLVLTELADGKLQKQIEAFSPNTVTKLLKNAMTRNKCKTKAELLHRFIAEGHNQSQSAAIESHDKSQGQSEQSQD